MLTREQTCWSISCVGLGLTGGEVDEMDGYKKEDVLDGVWKGRTGDIWRMIS